ncbi:MAG: glutaredoxin family protein [Mycobacterium sp.]|nr:glutaredoxin family protein [Mycobacterium sp.]
MADGPPEVTLLTRTGCDACDRALAQLERICGEFALSVRTVDVDAVAGPQPHLRAEFGDRLPVVLLNGREHSYFDVDERRLRRDLAQGQDTAEGR